MKKKILIIIPLILAILYFFNPLCGFHATFTSYQCSDKCNRCSCQGIGESRTLMYCEFFDADNPNIYFKENDRIVFDNTRITIIKGESTDVYFGLRNDLREDETFELMGFGKINNNDNPGKWEGGSIIACYDSIANNAIVSGQNDETDVIRFDTLKRKYLMKNETHILKLMIRVNAYTPSSIYQCSIIIEDPINRSSIYDRKDILITVIDNSNEN